MQIWPRFQNIVRTLAKPDIMFYALPWLMVLVVLGTITQKDIGLYEATQTYFHSIILWLGPVPTPGGLAVISLIFVSLMIKFLFFSKWNKKEAGIIITHLGILMLLLGGILTTATNREGFMIIPEGGSINAISDYRQRVLKISSKNKEPSFYNFDNLKINQEIEVNNLAIKFLEICENCSVQAPSGKHKNLKGLAKNMELFSVPSAKNKEENFSGLIFSVSKKDKDLGTYIVMEDIPKNPVFEDIEISLGRAQTDLPFSITLQDFRKIDYPGTMKAQEYESDLIVQDGDVSWPVTISMNGPLRYKGYSFYQSSFDQSSAVELTVLNVVKNSGRIFPYISSLIIFIGLLLHFIIRVRTVGKK